MYITKRINDNIMLKQLTGFMILLLLTFQTLAQQPLFNFRKEFPVSTFASIRPGMRYVIAPKRGDSEGFPPTLRNVLMTPKGPRPGAVVPLEPLRNTVFTFVKFVPFTNQSGRDQVVTLLNSNKGQYSFIIDYTMEQLTKHKFLSQMPDFINFDEFERARRLLEGKTIYPIIHYVEQDKNAPKDFREREYTYLPKMVPVKVTKVEMDNGSGPIRLTFTYPEGQPQVRSYSFSVENEEDHSNPIFNTSFIDCFSLSDLKLANPSVRDATWRAIQKGVPQKGMTMKECRLSMGKPKEQLDSVEQDQLTAWYYPDHIGRSWQVTFVNGKLTQAQSHQSN